MKQNRTIKHLIIFALKNFFIFSGYIFGLLILFLPTAKIVSILFYLSNCTPPKITFLFYGFCQSAFSVTKIKIKKTMFASKKLVTGSIINLNLLLKTQREIFFWKVYEPHVVRFFTGSIERGAWALDIGANVGYYSLIMSDLVGDEGRVIAFEPEKNNYLSLVQNIKGTSKLNIVSENLAVGERSEKKKLFLNLDNEGGHSFDHVPNVNAEFFEEVDVNSVDQYLKRFSLEEISRIKTVKIDVEGFELSVLRGMKDFLNRGQELSVVCEVSANQEQIFSFMKDLGYRIYELRSQQQVLLVAPSEVERKRDLLFKK